MRNHMIFSDEPAIVSFQWITNEKKHFWTAKAVCTFYGNTNKYGAQKAIDGEIGTESYFSSCGKQLHPWLQVKNKIIFKGQNNSKVRHVQGASKRMQQIFK